MSALALVREAGASLRLERIFNGHPELARFLAGFRPYRGIAVILRDEVESVTRGGIHIPEIARDDNKATRKHPVFKGTVLDVGANPWSKNGRRRVDVIVQPGDRVFIGRWGLVEIDRVKWLGIPNVFTMAALDILGFVEEDPS